ncbi:MAG: divalent-cation tolerance protein CutA [Candidatus Eisenbacteria bacterium]|nr:divalent-cation tolerance protein CutA [Candidatus Eisenbacteria bacterium]
MEKREGYAVLLVTAPADGAGETIARALVERRLAACVNRVPGIRSVYRWEGTIESGGEDLLIVKTAAPLLDRLEETIRELHPYEVPEMLVLPIDGGSAPYLDWIAASLEE